MESEKKNNTVKLDEKADNNSKIDSTSETTKPIFKWDPFITDFEKNKKIVTILDTWTYQEILS